MELLAIIIGAVLAYTLGRRQGERRGRILRRLGI